MRVLSFFKTALISGFFVVLPVLLLYLVLREVFDTVLALGQPIVDVLPENSLGDDLTARVVAVLLMVGMCLVTGFVVHLPFAVRIGNWIESDLLMPIPGYSVFRAFSNRFSGRDNMDFFRAALYLLPDGRRKLVFVVEECADGLSTILHPIAPTPAMGELEIVDSSRLTKIDASMAEAMECFWHWGAGTGALLKRADGA